MLAAGPFGLGPMELVIILLVLVMLFGASRLADIGGSLGKGIKEFRKEIQTEDGPEPAADAETSDADASASTNGDQSTVEAIKCSSCGALNDVDAKHCNQCGTAIGAPVS